MADIAELLTTAVAHHVPDWRWLLDRSDSPWYPTMRLFRQKSPGDWASVFAEITIALRERMRGVGSRT